MSGPSAEAALSCLIYHDLIQHIDRFAGRGHPRPFLFNKPVNIDDYKASSLLNDESILFYDITNQRRDLLNPSGEERAIIRASNSTIPPLTNSTNPGIKKKYGRANIKPPGGKQVMPRRTSTNPTATMSQPNTIKNFRTTLVLVR
jgi:hypothetical protein